MKVVSLVISLPGFEGQRMDPIGALWVIFLVNRQWSEWVRQSQTMTIAIKLILEFEGKIRNLSAKTFRWFYHLWTQLILAQTEQTQQLHIWNRLLLEQKLQTLRHWNEQQICQNARKNCTYQRPQSQTHHCQTRHRKNLIFPMTENTANLRARDAIKIKIVGNSGNRNRNTRSQENLISPKKVTIDVRDSIKRRATGKRTPSNYAQN